MDADGKDKCTVAGSLATVLRISSKVGLAPIHLVRSRCGYIASMPRGRTFGGYILIILLVILNGYKIYYITMVTAYRPFGELEKIHTVAKIITATSVILPAAYGGLNRMKQTIKLITKIKEINVEMENNKINIEYKKIIGFHLSVYIGNIVTNFMLIIYMRLYRYNSLENANQGLKDKLFFFGCYHLNSFLMLFIHMQFILKVKLLNETLRGLHKQLNDMIFQFDVFGSVMMATTEEYLRARHFCQTYITIRHLLHKINKQEGLILLLMLSCYVLEVLDIVFTAITKSRSEELPIIIISDILVGIMMMGYNRLTSLILLVETCHETLTEVQKVHYQICQLMSSSMHRQLSNEFCIFYIKRLQTSRVFCPLSIVDLSRPLYFKIGGCVLTLLAIMKQFQISGSAYL